MASCPHGDSIALPRLAEGEKALLACDACLATGSNWLHLRQCRTCGTIACCDSSPNRHARAHAQEERHPIISSAERGERWIYCYVDDAIIDG